jgi:amino acid transporter
MATPRVFFAMALDKLLPTKFARLSPVTRVPTRAIVVYASIAAVLAVLGNFDQLSNMAGFGYLVFYALNVGGLLRFLAKHRTVASRSRNATVVTVVAIIFLCGTSWLLITLVVRGRTEIVSALAIMALGVPAYLLMRRLRRRSRRRYAS